MPNLKKARLYALAAIIVGLTLIMVPLVALAEIGRQGTLGLVQIIPRTFKQVEGGNSDIPSVTQLDVETLGACFAIALIGYVFLRRSSHRERVFHGPYPY